MFTAEGNFPVIIKEVEFSAARFNEDDPTAFDICIRVEKKDDPSQSDWWRGEMSNAYGKGNVSHMTQAQLTMQTLNKLGFEDVDLSKLPEAIIETETEAWVKESDPNAQGKTFFNVRGLGGSASRPQSIGLEAAQERMKALMQNAPAKDAAPKPEPKAETAKPAAAAKNPFL